MKNPNFFVIGAPKCGTTALTSYLAEHPRAFMTSPKEAHYFSSDIDHGNYKNREEYRNLFREASSGHKAIGEAFVWYLFSTQAVKDIERQREPLGYGIKNNLQEEFESEIVKLKNLTGRCLSHWRH